MKTTTILLLSIFLTACASPVNIDYRPEANFNKIKTFQIQEKAVNITTDTRIDSPFMQQRTVEALKTGFTNKGLYVVKDKADVIVKYHMVIKQEFETDDSGVYFGFSTGTRHSLLGMTYAFPDRQVASVDDLVLTIDIVDPGNVLLWRGSLGRRLYSGSTPESSRRLINGLVTEILKQFPPR